MSITELAKEERVGFKSPAVMGGVGLILLLFFGILGREGMVSFESLGEAMPSSFRPFRQTHPPLELLPES